MRRPGTASAAKPCARSEPMSYAAKNIDVKDRLIFALDVPTRAQAL